MRLRAALPISIGIAFALGAALAGWTASLGVFALAYETLRAQAAEAPLDSTQALAHVRLAGWYLGLAAGGLTFWRWHRGDARLEATGRAARLKRVAVYALAGTGFTSLGYRFPGLYRPEDIVLACAVALFAGSAIIAAHYRGMAARALAGGTVAAGAVAAAAISCGLAFNKQVQWPYHKIGEPRTLWVRIHFPDGLPQARPADISVRMRTPSGETRCFAVHPYPDGFMDDRRPFLPVSCTFSEQTADRTVIVTVPGRPPLELKMPFVRNPRPMHDFSAWLHSRTGVMFRYRVT